MILSLTNKTTYDLNETEAKGVLEAIQAGERYAIVQGDYIMLNAIVAIQDEERLSEADHIRNGDTRCVHGEWHNRNDRCYGHDPKIKSVNEVIIEKQLMSDNRSEAEQYSAARQKVAQIREQFGW